MNAVSPLGLFGRLPLELRRKIYAIVFDGQIIHCCSSKGHSQRHGIARASSPISPCNIKAFEKECLECCESDFDPVIGAAKVASWSHVVSYSGSQFNPLDLLSLFLTCRTFWNEAEPLSWDLITLSIGVPQFSAFHDQFLRDTRTSHFVRIPRGQLLRNLQIIVPDHFKLASKMGHDTKFRHLSTDYVVSTTINESMGALASCTALKNASMMIGASLAIQDADPDMRVLLHFRIINLILRLKKPLEHFRIFYLGQLCSISRDHGDNYDDLPDNDSCKRKLRALTSILVDVLIGQVKLENIPESDFFDENDPGMVELGMYVGRYLKAGFELESTEQ